MTTIEQAREVSKRLHLGVSIANDHWLQAQQKLDAAKAELAAKTLDSECLRRVVEESGFTTDAQSGEDIIAFVGKQAAELASIKGQEPVGWMADDKLVIRDDFAAVLRWSGATVGTGRAIPNSWDPVICAPAAQPSHDYLAAGAQPFTLPKQEPLGAEFAKVLHDNLDDLYEDESAPVQAQERKPLNQNEILEAYESAKGLPYTLNWTEVVDFVRAIEAKIKEKTNAPTL